jgi:hypothetical protein
MDKNPDSGVITKWLSEELVIARARARSNLPGVEGIAHLHDFAMKC